MPIRLADFVAPTPFNRESALRTVLTETFFSWANLLSEGRSVPAGYVPLLIEISKSIASE